MHEKWLMSKKRKKLISKYIYHRIFLFLELYQICQCVRPKSSKISYRSNRIRRKSHSGSISNSSSGDKLNLALNFQSKTGDTRVHDMEFVEMELQMMEDHRRKDKKKHKDRKRKESEKLEHRSKHKERKNSMDDSDEPTASPKNHTSKQKCSKEDDEFSSDSEWKEFRLKGK